MAWLEVGSWRADRRRESARQQLELAVSARSLALAAAVEHRLALLDGLRSFVELEVDSGRLSLEFPAFASRIASIPGLRNLAVARGSKYELVYPIVGNERVVGYDLLEDPRPEVREDARRVLTENLMVVSGPLELVQGGMGLIVRRAVTRNGRVWGLVALVIDLAPILKEAGLDPPPPNLHLAARIEGRPAFTGSNRLFLGDAVKVKVQVPWAHWELAGQFGGQWLTALEDERRLWTASGLVLALIPTGLVFAIAWRQRVRHAYHLHTERLVEERTAALARSSLVVQNSPVVLVRWRRGPGWPVDYVSDNIAQFGYAAADFQSGRVSWGDIMWAEDRLRLEAAPPTDPQAGMHLDPQEYRIVTADGGFRWMEDRTSVISEGGALVYQGIVIDITERKQREEAQREQRQLEDHNRQLQKMEAVGQLAGGVAHDFNNLLQVIGGYANLLLEEWPPSASGYAEVSEIQRATDRASVLVRQLLAFSRRQSIERRLIQPADTIADLLKMLRRVIGEHIELEFAPSADTPTILADPGQLEQVLVNLCVNARDAMPNGGRINISTSREDMDDQFCREHDLARGGPFVVIRVADTGPGIPAAVIDHIFEPFFTTKEVGKGTGLGLATVYGIVKQHEGMIDVSSPPDEGAVFRIFFRAAAGEATPVEASPVAASALTGHETILLAEDEEMVRNLARRVLEHAGYRVIVACNGTEAMACVDAQREHIHLAVLDVVMPGYSGRQVQARIRTLHPEMPVLYCSGYSSQVLDDSPDATADEHVELLLKPYAPHALLERVRAILARASDSSTTASPTTPLQ